MVPALAPDPMLPTPPPFCCCASLRRAISCDAAAPDSTVADVCCGWPEAADDAGGCEDDIERGDPLHSLFYYLILFSVF